MKKEHAEPMLETILSKESTYQLREEGLLERPENISKLETLVAPETRRLDGIVIGLLVGFEDSGKPLVDFLANACGRPLAALSTVTLGKSEIGREAALLFEEGDPTKPIVIGLIQQPEALPCTSCESASETKPNPVKVEADGERLIISAEKEIVLRCGDASITLTRAGKVLIRGAYLLSRSSGVNRIKGGSVQIN